MVAIATEMIKIEVIQYYNYALTDISYTHYP